MFLIMGEQTLIQVRVDTQLKEQAAEVFDKIGIDIPTAVRMLFKATVREQGLPFSANIATASRQPSEAEALFQYVKNMIMYEPPIEGDDVNCIMILPLENGRDIPVAMFIQLLMKVPDGKITRWEDIFAYLSKLYDKEVWELPHRPFPHIDSHNRSIPYWRIVSSRGALEENRWNSREQQKKQLILEGLPVIQRGSIEGSYRVKDYKEYLFDYNVLKVIPDAKQL